MYLERRSHLAKQCKDFSATKDVEESNKDFWKRFLVVLRDMFKFYVKLFPDAIKYVCF